MIRGECFLVGPSLWSPGPAVLASFDPGNWSDKATGRATDRLLSVVPELQQEAIFRRNPTLIGAVAGLADLLSGTIGAGWGRSRILPGSDGGLRLAIASPRPQLARHLVSGLNDILQALPHCSPSLIEDVLRRLLAAWESPAEAALLAGAARARRIPVTWPDAEQNWMVLGQGVRRHIYHRGYFSTGGGLRDLADDKLASARLLERAGLPSTRPGIVTTAEHAITRATALGMPVVLKPNRGWAQVGVWTHLGSPEAVRAAFRRASTQSGPLYGPLIIERHRIGRHLRATLVAGDLRAVVMYETPAVTGDGVRTAEALAKEYYRVPAGDALGARGRGILEAVLSHQGLGAGSVVGRGRSCIVGHESQGRSVDVTGTIHPSLRALLNRVGRLFPTPILGVDVIVRDPSAVVDDEHDAIIEVNPAPAFSVHERPAEGRARNLAGPVLDHLFPAGAGAARVPVVAGPSGCAAELEKLGELLRRRGVRPAGYTRNRAWAGSPHVERGRGPLGLSLLPIDADAEVLLLEVDEVVAGVVGLPVDQVDFLEGSSSGRTPVNAMLARLGRTGSRRRWSADDVLRACRPPRPLRSGKGGRNRP